MAPKNRPTDRHRIQRMFTIAPETDDLLNALSEASGVKRSRIVDLAVDHMTTMVREVFGPIAAERWRELRTRR